MSLPGNNQRIFDIVSDASDGVEIEDLRQRLRAEGINFTTERLEKLPSRFPDHFELKDGHLRAVSRTPFTADESWLADDADQDQAQGNRWERAGWWNESDIQSQAPTTATITCVSVCHEVDDPDRTPSLVVRLSDGQVMRCSFDRALGVESVSCRGVEDLRSERAEAVLKCLIQSEVVCGFDLGPFNAWLSAFEDHHVAIPMIDLAELSLLSDPTAIEHGLYGVAARHGLDASSKRVFGPRRSLEDHVELLGLVAGSLIAEWQAGDAIPALSRKVLEASGHPLGRVAFARRVVGSLREELWSRDDELLVPTPGSARPGSAHRAADDGFAVLERDGGLAQRHGQLAMADKVAVVLDRGGRVAVEAPTGTGKSLAYLVPACGGAQRGPVVIATHTKVLQRQLRSDATRLRNLGVLGVPYRQIFGVSNYICLREIGATLFDGAPETAADGLALAVAIHAVRVAESGIWDDISDRDATGNDARYFRSRRALVASTGTCERGDCDFAAQCPMMKRLSGMEEQPGIISTNHALLALWFMGDGQEPDQPASSSPPQTRSRRRTTAPGSESAGPIAGKPTSLILDEAHTAEAAFTSAWTRTVGAEELERLLKWVWSGRGPVANASRFLVKAGLEDVAQGVREHYQDDRAGESLRSLSASVGTLLYELGGSHMSLSILSHHRRYPEVRVVQSDAALLAAQLDGLRKGLAAVAAAVSETGLDGRYRVTRQLDAAIDELLEMSEVLRALQRLEGVHRSLHLLSARVSTGLRPTGTEREGREDRRSIAARTWTYELVPIEIGEMFRNRVTARCYSVVLTSATLRVDSSFDFISRRLWLGVGEEDDPLSFEADVLESPFNYDEQSMVVLTNHLPTPTPTNERAFVEDVASDQAGFLSLSGGRALVLFAARARMDQVAERLEPVRGQLLERGVEVLVQGAGSPAELRDRFRNELGVVLYGLRSYWEGFDAPGEALSFLFIEKPPYPHPGDALTQARRRLIEDRGGDPFRDYIVPLTAITMAQGFGRLIRSERDRGVAYIYDRRLQQPSASNGTLLSALPTTNFQFAHSRDEAWRLGLQFVDQCDVDLSGAIALIADTRAEVLERLRLDEGEDPLSKLREAASEIFGIDELYPEQEQIMCSVLTGKDTLGFLPTGRGKSICYQLPALLHPSQLPVIVVSPLVALIKDQVDELRARRGLRSVVGITGRTSKPEQVAIMRDLADGNVRLLYISPERLVRDPMLRNSLSEIDLGALVVDEAHCISAWGHDFRPEFRQIAPAVASLRRSPRLGLTATATKSVETDIAETLEMVEPTVVRQPTDRPEIRFYSMHVSSNRERTRELLRFVAANSSAPGIVYASRRSLTEEVAWVLRQVGYSARSYHAGMLPEQREAVQEDFLGGDINIVVATKAFGMGVNKSDIGWVVHYDPPDSLESYAQEAGRAARAEGMTATALVLWSRSDLRRQAALAGSASAIADPNRAEAALGYLQRCPERGLDVVVDAEAMAETLDVEEDELNVIISWLEQLGHVERQVECAVKGRLTLGRVEPRNPVELAQFVEITKVALGCKVNVDRRVDLHPAAERIGMTPDELETLLTRWTLQRYVTFHPTQRRWRVRLVNPTFDELGFRRLVSQWRNLQKSRLMTMEGYLQRSRCRRSAIAETFSDPPRVCRPGEDELCDVCAGGVPPWHSVPLERVPDPESFVDVPLVVLKAVAWASKSPQPLSAKSLRHALLGDETSNGHPLAPSAFRCPQFGALRPLRNAVKQFDVAVDGLIASGMIERADVTIGERSWVIYRLTARGAAEVGERVAERA